MSDNAGETRSKPPRKRAKTTPRPKRRRRTKLFPASPFEEALTIPNA